jgi:ribosome modulation factor
MKWRGSQPRSSLCWTPALRSLSSGYCALSTCTSRELCPCMNFGGSGSDWVLEWRTACMNDGCSTTSAANIIMSVTTFMTNNFVLEDSNPRIASLHVSQHDAARSQEAMLLVHTSYPSDRYCWSVLCWDLGRLRIDLQGLEARCASRFALLGMHCWVHKIHTLAARLGIRCVLLSRRPCTHVLNWH